MLDRFPGVAWVGSAAAFWAASTQIGQNGRPCDLVTDTTYFLSQRLRPGGGPPSSCRWCSATSAGASCVACWPIRDLLYVGLISCGVYLYHLLAFGLLAQWGLCAADGGGRARVAVSGPAGAVLPGALSYYVVERPALSLKRLVGSHGAAPDQPGAISAPVAPVPPES